MRVVGRIVGWVVIMAFAATAQAQVDRISLRPGDERQVKIDSRAPWISTGVVIRSGERYEIRVEGAWSLSSLLCGFSDADGIGAVESCRSDPEKLGLKGSALIGRIGPAGKPFHVGKRLSLTAGGDGELQLRAYDDPVWQWDNSGVMQVIIARAAAPAKMAAAAPSAFPRAVLEYDYAAQAARPDDVAVIIGNANYGKLAKDIPDVVPAYADAESFKRYAIAGLGVREGNIIDLRDATKNQLERVFGTERNHVGQLFDWTRPGKSRVTVYYAGHGAPGGKDGGAYLVPVDADASRIELNGYPLRVLYANLAKLPALAVTVILEACFSGASPGGSVIAKASGLHVTPKVPETPKRLTVISAGGGDQMASWENDKSNGLFTKYYLKGMSGDADAEPHGNGDGAVSTEELDRYLRRTMSYFARRYYGRDQVAQFATGN